MTKNSSFFKRYEGYVDDCSDTGLSPNEEDTPSELISVDHAKQDIGMQESDLKCSNNDQTGGQESCERG